MSRKPFCSTLLLSAALLIFAPPSFAKSNNQGGKGNRGSQFRTMARLTPCCGGPEPDATGRAYYMTKTKKGRVEQIDFKTVVKLPLAAVETLPVDPDLRLILSHEGVEYAECLLVREEDDEHGEHGEHGNDDDGEEDEVEFRLDLREKKGRFEEKKGSCDIDLEAAGEQPGIPVVRVGDVTTITVVADPPDPDKDIDFLMGVFK